MPHHNEKKFFKPKMVKSVQIPQSDPDGLMHMGKTICKDGVCKPKKQFQIEEKVELEIQEKQPLVIKKEQEEVLEQLIKENERLKAENNQLKNELKIFKKELNDSRPHSRPVG